MRFHLVTCDMLLRPVAHLAARSPHEIVLHDLSASLHAEPRSLGERIQAEIDEVEAVDPSADAVLLGYGLCGGATAGIVARGRPIVLPRAHDCATILLGSRERYQREHEATPGTYWFTEDNARRGDALKGWLLGDAGRSDAVEATRRDWTERFGEDNADYLMTTLGEWQRHYERGAFLDTGPVAADETAWADGADSAEGSGLAEESALAEAEARAESERRGWRFERVAADLGLLARLVAGDWDDDFIVVEPGQQLAMSYDADILRTMSAIGALALSPAGPPGRPR